MAKNKTENKVLFIDASKEFKKETNNNILEEKNINTINEVENIYEANKNNPVIIFDDFTSGNHWVDFNFKVKSSAMKILKPKEGVNLRYCYHYIKTINIETREHKRLWISKFSQIEIPLPSLPVQEYVVSILDKFYKLVNDVKDDLPKEIDLRQKQYEYYRERLLNFHK